MLNGPDADVRRHCRLLCLEHALGQSRGALHVAQRPRPVEAAVDRGQVGERRRLREELERQPVAGVVGVEQVARVGQQPAPVLGRPALVDGVELLHPRPGLGAGERGRVGRHADLPAAQLARDVHRAGHLRGGQHAARVEQRLVRHQQAARALLGQRDRGGEVRVDALAVAGQLRQLLLHGLLLLEAGLAHVVQRGADHQIGQAHVALHVGERAVAVQRGADVGRRARVAVEEDVLPRDLDVVEDDAACRSRRSGSRSGSRPRARGPRSRRGRCASAPSTPCRR